MAEQNLQKEINRSFAADKLLLENTTKNIVNRIKVTGIIKFFSLIVTKLVLLKINHLLMYMRQNEINSYNIWTFCKIVL